MILMQRRKPKRVGLLEVERLSRIIEDVKYYVVVTLAKSFKQKILL